MPAPSLDAVPAPRPSDPPPLCFLLGQNARGLWVIRERTGGKAGLFVSREAALRFARQESPEERYSVVDVNGGLEFDYAG
jgi:hypothetical protein